MPPALDPVIHQPTRLRIMSLLHRNRQASFNDLRFGLDLTPGNLSSHTSRLEEAGYIKSGRLLVDLSFEVHYRITDRGAAAFLAYLTDLQELLRSAGLDATLPAGAAPTSPLPTPAPASESHDVERGHPGL